VATYLRFANLQANPGWDGDEGYNWSIAANLLAGHLQMFGLRYAFVQHPPLFYVLGAAVMRLWTHDLIALRALSAACGVLTVLMVYLVGARLDRARLGIAAAIFYAIWPQAVLQVRWAYTYNLLALLLSAALWAALPRKYPRAHTVSPTGAMAGAAQVTAHLRATLAASGVAGVLAGLALVTDQEAVALLPALAVLLWARGPRSIVVGALATAVLPAAYVTWMLVVRTQAFLFDVRNSASRLTTSPVELLSRFQHLVSFEPFIAAGLVGLCLLPRGAAKRGVWLGTLCLLATVLAVRDPAPYFRAAEPLLPLAAVGTGALVCALLRGFSWLLAPLRQSSGPDDPADAATLAPRRGLVMRTAASLMLTVPFCLTMLATDLTQVQGRFVTGLDKLLPQSAAEAQSMADWVNLRVHPDDLVLAMPDIAWLFHCHSADLLQAVAITGVGTSFYPSGLGSARFAYDTRLQAARFLVVDDFTRLWISQNPPERSLVTQAARSWAVVYRRGEYVVYANPLDKLIRAGQE
jgi:4-amino-4-deoxy-L-arabinose transferase-like glycosyltransferase